jgi:hypothetical protein
MFQELFHVIFTLLKITIKCRYHYKNCQPPVAHTCNSNYSEGRNQEAAGLKLTQGK